MPSSVTLTNAEKVDIIASFLPAGSTPPGPTSYSIDNTALGTFVPLASDPNSTTFVTTDGAVGTGTINGTSGALSDTVAVNVTAAVATSMVLTPGTPVAK